MRFTKLSVNGNSTTNQDKIESILLSNHFYWLIDSEVENATIEIKNNTLIWHSGVFYTGRWHYGIWKSGDFYGIWENGIFENGNFNGKFISGIIPDKLVKKNKL
jgi:hypothetical protein